MINSLENLLANNSDFLLLLAVLLLKLVLNKIPNLQPLSFFSAYCRLLANKVNKTQNTYQQQAIAGFVGILVTLPVLIIMLALFEMFIEVPWLWHGFLLFLALGNLDYAKQGKKIAQALVAKNNYQAKQLLAPLTLRDTEQLSPMGISKAFIEGHLLKISQQIITVSFYYLVFGPLTALTFRLLLEMHYSWNTKCQRYYYFGYAATWLSNLLQWLPSRIFGLSIFVFGLKQDWLLCWRLAKKSFFTNNNNFLIHCFALVNGIELGGVAMYEKHKLRRQAFNQQAKQPEPSDIIYSSSRLTKTLIILLCLVSITALLPGFLS